jgi:hypothetical protein
MVNGRSLARYAQGFQRRQVSPRVKAHGEGPNPLMPEEMEKAIREMPRDAEVIDLLKKLSSDGPLPPR